MAWYLGGCRVYVEKDTGWQSNPRMGEIEVLDSKETIIHNAGRPSYARTLVFVVFSGYHNNILPLADNLVYPSGVILLSDQLPAGNGEGKVHIKSLKAERLYDRSRTTAVFRVTSELIQDGEDGS